MTLVALDASSELAVSDYLTRARDWLATAVERTGPEQIAAAKAEIATAAEATKQLGLSKEIQLDATEMVRRAEYALDKAVRKGQSEGLIKDQSAGGGVATPGMRGSSPRSDAEQDDRPSARDFFGSAQARSEAYQMGNAAPDDFEQALGEAKAEGNLSRANVVRKVKAKAAPPATRDARADLIDELAAQGYSSRQMVEPVGVSEARIREIARAYNVEIPADKVMGKTRRHDSNRIASQTVAALEGLAMGVELINYDDLDAGEAAHWVDSLTHSLRALNRFSKQVKETTQ